MSYVWSVTHHILDARGDAVARTGAGARQAFAHWLARYESPGDAPIARAAQGLAYDRIVKDVVVLRRPELDADFGGAFMDWALIEGELYHGPFGFLDKLRLTPEEAARAEANQGLPARFRKGAV